MALTGSVWAQTLDPRLVTEDGFEWISGDDAMIFKSDGNYAYRKYGDVMFHNPLISMGSDFNGRRVYGAPDWVKHGKVVDYHTGKWETNEKNLVVTSQKGFASEYFIQDNSDSLILFMPDGKSQLFTRRKTTRKIAEENLLKSNEFLESNKKRAGVITTESGLQYEILAAGKPKKKKATNTSTPLMRFDLKLIDGRKVDNARITTDPSSIAVRNLIKGAAEGIKLMEIGSTYRFYIPPHLAHGEEGIPVTNFLGETEAVPPNSVLVFEVKLVGKMY